MQKSGQRANPDLNVKVLTKGTTKLFVCSLKHHFPSYPLTALTAKASVFQYVMKCFHYNSTICTVHSLTFTWPLED